MKQPENILLAGNPSYLTEMVNRELKLQKTQRYILHPTNVLKKQLAVVGGKKPRIGIACFETEREGIRMSKELKIYYPDTLFLAFCTAMHPEELFDLIRSGYVGVLYMEEVKEIFAAIKMVLNFGCVCNRRLFQLLQHPKCVFEKIKDPQEWNKVLSPAMYRVLEQIAARPEMSNQQVADNLCISIKTVGNHLTKLYGSVGVHSRNELTRKIMTVGTEHSQ